MYTYLLAAAVLISSACSLKTTPASPWHTSSSHQILSGGIFKDDNNKTLRNDGFEKELGSGPPGTYETPWSQDEHSFPPQNDAYGPINDNRFNRFSNQGYRQQGFNVPNHFDSRILNTPVDNRLLYEDPRYRLVNNHPYGQSYNPAPVNENSLNGQSYYGSQYNPQNYKGLPYNPSAYNGLQHNPHIYNGLPQNPQTVNGSPYNRPVVNPYSSQNVRPYSFNQQIHDNSFNGGPQINSAKNWQDADAIQRPYTPNSHRAEGRTFTPQGVLWNGPVRYMNSPFNYRAPVRNWNGPNDMHRRPYSYRPGNYPVRQQQNSQDPRYQVDYPFTNTAPIQFSNNQ